MPGQLIPNLITGVHKVSPEEAAIAHFTNVINLFLIPPEWNRGLGFKIEKCMHSTTGQLFLVSALLYGGFQKEEFQLHCFPLTKEKHSNWYLGGGWSPFFGNGFDCTSLS